MVHRGNWVLPELGLLGNERAKVTRDRPHVAVRQFEPRLRERIRELVRMLVEPPRNLFVSWIKAQREIGGQHGGRVTLRRIMCVWNSSCAGAVLRGPLMRTSRALGQFPVVLEQGLEEVVAPLRRRAGP